jgi:Fe-S-cluster containining protein
MSNAHSPDKGYDLISKGVELCLSCGICCKGTLHDRAHLEPDETELVSQLGLTLYQNNVDYGAFDLPCPCFKDGKCSVYAQRPRKCGNFQCKLLKGYLQGLISFGESTELVKKAKSLMEAIYKHIGGG